MARAALNSALARVGGAARELIRRQPEWVEAQAVLRRAKLRAFLRGLDSPALATTTARAGEEAALVLAGKGASSVFNGKEQLGTTLTALHSHLLPCPLPPISRDATADWPTPPDPFLPVEEHEEQDSSDSRAAAEPPQSSTTTTPSPAFPPRAPPNPLDLPDPFPVELSEEEQATLAAMRLSAATRNLPPLWKDLTADGERALELSQVTEAILALGSGVPSIQMRYRLQLIRGLDAPLGDADAKELRAAAMHVVEEVQPFFYDLLTQSTLLQPSEQAYLDRLRETPAVLFSLLHKRTIGMRLRDLFRARTEYEVTQEEELDVLQLARARDPSAHRLYEALSSEATLHLALSRAVLAHHDQWYYRRARVRLAAMGLVTFVGLNILDFTISNI